MTETELRDKCVLLAAAGCAVSSATLHLFLELEGERKANALLLAGMESITERTDWLKMRVRELEDERDNLRAMCDALADRCARQSELLGQRAEQGDG